MDSMQGPHVYEVRFHLTAQWRQVTPVWTQVIRVSLIQLKQFPWNHTQISEPILSAHPGCNLVFWAHTSGNPKWPGWKNLIDDLPDLR